VAQSPGPMLRNAIALTALAFVATITSVRAESIVETGKKRFVAQCAVCHGTDGTGGGPLANLLRTPPPDLSTISKRHGGEFPFGLIYGAIDGRPFPQSHGTRQMPIWGREIENEGTRPNSETYVRGRILELILFLRSIQQR